MEGKQNSRPAQLFIALIVFGGLATATYATRDVHAWHPLQFPLLLVAAVLASRLKLKLPGLNGNMSVNLPFILIAQAQVSPAEALIVACTSTLTQCLPRAGAKFKPVQILFNISTTAIAVELGCLLLNHGQYLKMMPAGTLLLGLSAVVYFLFTTMPVASIISLSEGHRILGIWSSIFRLSFPYYMVSAGVTSMVVTASRHVGWLIPLLVFPVMYGTYRSYQLYFGRLPARTGAAGLARQ